MIPATKSACTLLTATVAVSLSVACAAPPAGDDDSSAATSESASSQLKTLEQKVERALALAVARGASESFLARPTSQGGVGLTAAAARSIVRHRLGPDGLPDTSDDGKL